MARIVQIDNAPFYSSTDVIPIKPTSILLRIQELDKLRQNDFKINFNFDTFFKIARNKLFAHKRQIM